MPEEYTNYLISADEKYIRKIFKAKIINYDYKKGLLLVNKKIYNKKTAEKYIIDELIRIPTKIRLVHQKGGGKLTIGIEKFLRKKKNIEVLSLDNFIEKYANDITSKNTLQR